LTTPYDGGFEGLPGAPPFNWRHHDPRAERQEGGLYASYLGRGAPLLLEQVFTLSAGRYRLTAAMRGETRTSGGGFRWTVSCLPAGAEVARLDVVELTGAERTFEVAFTVPADGCAYQRLLLSGRPDEFPLAAYAVTRRVAIEAMDEPTNNAPAD
jgi:hypothetical protein